MKRIQSVLVFTAIFFSFAVSVSAQGIRTPGMIDMMPNINTNIDNMINSRRVGGAVGRGSSGKSAETVRGEAIIKAGRAKNTFVPSAAGARLTIETTTFEATEPQDFAGQLRLIQGYVKRFNGLMANYNFRVNDVADGIALAFALSYEAANDKKPSLNEVNRIREEYRQKFLQNAYFQGDSDVKKQKFYEDKAMMSIQAIDWREKARRAATRSERQIADEKAKRFAAYLLR